jgi:hypothetical protein
MGVVVDSGRLSHAVLGVFLMKKVLIAGVAVLLMTTGTAHAEKKWETDWHRCMLEKFVTEETELNVLKWTITPEDIPNIERELKELKRCDAFYTCVAERDGYVKPKGKRPKHCYANDRRWR